MSWTPNPGKPPRTTKSLMVRWSTGKVEGPYAPESWRKFNWDLGHIVNVEAVQYVDG